MIRHWFIAAAWVGLLAAAPTRAETPVSDFDFAFPNEKLMTPAHLQTPIRFVTRNQSAAVWEKLPKFWNVTPEVVIDPISGKSVERSVIQVKLPLGLTQGPPVPLENPMTLAKWQLGKKLYYDPILSSNASVSCASCHSPETGFSNHTKVSSGIFSKKGGMNSPTVIGSAYNKLQFWDGRADSLEHQAQGPVGNPAEMFDGKGEPWNAAVERMRKNPEYVEQFQAIFGHLPTRDSAAKAIATYERTVLSGNSITDRADVAMLRRVEDEEGTNFTVTAADYETVLKEAVAKKDAYALTALGTDGSMLTDTAKRLANGRAIFAGKARCTNCHVGDTYTDHQFHNLGVGVLAGKLPPTVIGRFGSQPLGHKNPEHIGAFKTPSLRALLGTKPYMHDGSEGTLEAVVDFYDRGGNANEFLDAKMRDVEAERQYQIAKANGTEYRGPKVFLCGPNQKPIAPFELKLTADEKKDLVLFLRSLEGDPIPEIVSDPGNGL